MSSRKILIASLASTAIVTGLVGLKSLKKGLGTGSKIGFAAGASTGVLATTSCILAIKKIKKKRALMAEVDI